MRVLINALQPLGQGLKVADYSDIIAISIQTIHVHSIPFHQLLKLVSISHL